MIECAKSNSLNLYTWFGLLLFPRMEMDMEGLTVGRMVHYVAYGTPKGEFPQNVHRAAVVTEVEDAEKGVVALCVLNPTGIFFNQHLPYLADGSKPGTWHWIEKA